MMENDHKCAHAEDSCGELEHACTVEKSKAMDKTSADCHEPAANNSQDRVAESITAEAKNEDQTDEKQEQQDPDLELQRHTTTASEPLYSVFTHRQKIFITMMASVSCFYSPFTASVYFPAINTLAKHYHTTPSRINLSVTTYMILQGIAPMFTGDLGDRLGRRAAVNVCFVIYLAANIGLALQNSYAALLVLRCLQAAGSSGTVALARGIIADIATPAERGSYMGWTMTMVAFAPALAPVIGGLLAQTLGWRAIFWFLTIFSGCFLILYVALMPETNRTVVGDGSIRPTKWYHVSPIDGFMKHNSSFVAPQASTKVDVTSDQKPRGSLIQKVVNYFIQGPFRAIMLFFEPDIAVLSIYVCTVYGALYCVLTSLPVLFGPVYHFSDLQVGLCYIPIGAGCGLAGFSTGTLLDWNWKRQAIKNKLPYDRRKALNTDEFPMERARLEMCFPVLVPGILAILPFGWSLQYHAPLAVPLILQFFIGWSTTSASNMVANLTVDLFPGMAATVSANNNLARCLFGAGAAAVIDPMLRGMGFGWCYIFIGLVTALGSFPVLYWEIRMGPKWRRQRRLRQQRKSRKNEDRTEENKVKFDKIERQ